MSASSSTSSDSLEAGLLALGLAIGSNREQRDPRMAARVFAVATRADPLMADAWLGRLAAGEKGLAVYEGLWRARTRLGHHLSRYRLAPADLAVKVELPVLLVAPLVDADGAEAAYVSALLKVQRFAESEEVLTATGTSRGALSRFCAGCLYHQSARWPQVLDAVSGLRNDASEPVVAAAARVLSIEAFAYLGLFTTALELGAEGVPGDGRRLHDVVPQASATLAYHLGACHRALGQQDTATEFFRSALASAPDDHAAAAMLADPALVLRTTDAARIAARTDPWDPVTESAADDLARERDAADREVALAAAMAALEEHIGLRGVKHEVTKLRAQVEMAEVRKAEGLPETHRSRHLVLAGPPGTGKTEIARILAKILAGLGVIAEPKLTETSRKDFVAEYEGQSAALTTRTVDRALDGVLFIDEAYALVQKRNGRDDPFGKEALDTLLARMENDRDRLVVVVAGYRDEMDRFVAANEGLSSRFPKRIDFPSYSPSELISIAAVMTARTEHRMTAEAAALLESVCEFLAVRTAIPPPPEWETGDQGGRVARKMLDVLGNGRFMRNVVEQTIGEQELRLHAERAAGIRGDLGELTVDDVRAGLNVVIGGITELDVARELPELDGIHGLPELEAARPLRELEAGS